MKDACDKALKCLNPGDRIVETLYYEVVECDSCRGSGEDTNGKPCPRCNGFGKRKVFRLKECEAVAYGKHANVSRTKKINIGE